MLRHVVMLNHVVSVQIASMVQHQAVACPGIRRGGGGGENLKAFFLLFNFSRGGGSSENSRENDISD